MSKDRANQIIFTGILWCVAGGIMIATGNWIAILIAIILGVAWALFLLLS